MLWIYATGSELIWHAWLLWWSFFDWSSYALIPHLKESMSWTACLPACLWPNPACYMIGKINSCECLHIYQLCVPCLEFSLFAQVQTKCFLTEHITDFSLCFLKLNQNIMTAIRAATWPSLYQMWLLITYNNKTDLGYVVGFHVVCFGRSYHFLFILFLTLVKVLLLVICFIYFPLT